MISAFLKIESTKSGKLKGPVQDRDENKNGSIALLALEHGINAPRDPASGQAAGRRQHQPISFLKETDFTSPYFYQFITTNELLKTAQIFFYGSASQPGFNAGKEALLYKITLNNASVSKVEFTGHNDVAAQPNARFALTEKVSMVYESIEWEWKIPNTSAADIYGKAP